MPDQRGGTNSNWSGAAYPAGYVTPTPSSVTVAFPGAPSSTSPAASNGNVVDPPAGTSRDTVCVLDGGVAADTHTGPPVPVIVTE